eukprot:7289890-Pyramimonas_sp.AAC.6
MASVLRPPCDQQYVLPPKAHPKLRGGTLAQYSSRCRTPQTRSHRPRSRGCALFQERLPQTFTRHSSIRGSLGGGFAIRRSRWRCAMGYGGMSEEEVKKRAEDQAKRVSLLIT